MTLRPAIFMIHNRSMTNSMMKILVVIALLVSSTRAQDPSAAPAAPAAPVIAPFTPAPDTEAPVVPVAPPTLAPVVAPTDAPVVPPTPAPVIPPTSPPTTLAPITPRPTTGGPMTIAPTSTPSVMPTTLPPTPKPVATDVPSVAPISLAPTGAPVSPAPITDAPITPAPITMAPTTKAPITEAPTPVKSLSPSDVPTPSPSGISSAKPSKGPEPSASPSTGGSPQPTFDVTNTGPIGGFQMTFTGMQPLSPESTLVWQDNSETWCLDFYRNTDPQATGADDVTKCTFTLTSQDPPHSGRRLSPLRRILQSSSDTTITYSQELSYRQTNSETTPETVASSPFITEELRKGYVDALQQTNDPAFQSISSVSAVTAPEGAGGDSGGLPTAAIAGIAVGGAVGLMLLLGLGYMMCKGSSNPSGYFGDVGDAPPKSISAGPDEVSTLAGPSKVTGAGELTDYGDQSLGTVDYDYEGAYGGGASHSVSSAGGTFGSNPQALGANQGAVAAAGGAATLGGFSDDGSFGEAGVGANVREELIDIYAPAGKLGVVIDTPDDGAPVVHAIKDSSPIADKLQVGDKLVAVDDEDVRTMTAIKVSKLISRKSANPTRKLSIIRTTLVE